MATTEPIMTQSKRMKRSGFWVAGALWLLGSMALLPALLRIANTGGSLLSGVPPTSPDDMHYALHPWLTALHVIPGVLFLILGPFQFVSSVRERWPRWHRISGRVFVACALTIGVTAIAINVVFPPFGGIFKSLAVFTFGGAQIVCILIALFAILRKNVARHRSWMIRGFAIGLSVSTMRIFFIPAFLVFGMAPTEFNIGLGMWVGFLVNTFAAELILWRERAGVRRALSAA